jgi:hypothetical protein
MPPRTSLRKFPNETTKVSNHSLEKYTRRRGSDSGVLIYGKAAQRNDTSIRKEEMKKNLSLHG